MVSLTFKCVNVHLYVLWLRVEPHLTDASLNRKPEILSGWLSVELLLRQRDTVYSPCHTCSCLMEYGAGVQQDWRSKIEAKRVSEAGSNEQRRLEDWCRGWIRHLSFETAASEDKRKVQGKWPRWKYKVPLYIILYCICRVPQRCISNVVCNEI